MLLFLLLPVNALRNSFSFAMFSPRTGSAFGYVICFPICNLVSYVERAPRHFRFEETKQKGRHFDCFKSAL